MQVVVFDASGAVVPVQAQVFHGGERSGRWLPPGEQALVRCRVTAEVMAALAPGRYRLSVSYRAPTDAAGAARAGGQGASARAPQPAWAGVTEATEVTLDVVTPPEPLPADLAAERLDVLVADRLFEAGLLRAVARRADLELAQRQDAVRRMAATLVAAEALALEGLDTRPLDRAAAWNVARVYAAQGDLERAELYARGGEGASSFGAVLRARAICSVAPLEPASLAATLREALALARGGEPPGPNADSAESNATPPSPPAATPLDQTGAKPIDQTGAKPPGATAATPPKVVGEVSSGDPSVLDASFASDERAQWAAAASASSQYSSPTYSASRVIGPPEVAAHGDDANAWAPSTPDGGAEWLRCTFARAVFAAEVRVRQTYHPGAIARVTLAGAGGRSLVVFEGVDPTAYPAGQVGWFVVRFPDTDFVVDTVTVDFDTARVGNWNEVDAVQLVGRAK